MAEERNNNKIAILIIITAIILIALIITGLVYYTKTRNENRQKIKMESQDKKIEDRIEDPFLNKKQVDKAMEDLSNELNKNK